MGSQQSKLQIFNPFHHSVIYEILCLLTGERYIGSTTDLRKRINKHISSHNECSSK